MRNRILAKVVLAFAAVIALQPATKAQQPTAESVAPSAKEQPFTIVLIPPSDAALPDMLKAAVPKAKQAGLKPYAYFYADWCGPCKALRKSLDDADPLMMDAFRGTYIIQLNADTWGKKLAGTKFTVKAIPVLFELDKNGKPTGRMIDGSAWGEDIPKNMAPPLKAFFQKSFKK
jgi:thiol-disulfide isomerase/thioredoxin